MRELYMDMKTLHLIGHLLQVIKKKSRSGCFNTCCKRRTQKQGVAPTPVLRGQSTDQPPTITYFHTVNLRFVSTAPPRTEPVRATKESDMWRTASGHWFRAANASEGRHSVRCWHEAVLRSYRALGFMEKKRCHLFPECHTLRALHCPARTFIAKGIDQANKKKTSTRSASRPRKKLSDEVNTVEACVRPIFQTGDQVPNSRRATSTRTTTARNYGKLSSCRC